MKTSREVARLVLQLCQERGVGVSQLKLQKLMYYIQGYHLSATGRALFEEDIYAWRHGPVERCIYNTYREYGGGVIPVFNQVDIASFTEVSLDIVNYVLDTLGNIGAWRLVDKTHSEKPWRNHVDESTLVADNQIISHEELKDYFDEVVQQKQDHKLANIMDEINSEVAFTIPDNVDSADAFSAWIDEV